MKKWLEENQERIENAKSLPYWVRDNGKYVERTATRSQHTGQEARDIHDQRDTASAELRERIEARRKYNSYGEEWERAYFNEENGGFNVYHKLHQFSDTKATGAKMSGGDAEKYIGRTLADTQAKQIEFLPENGKGKGKPDLAFDGKTWDVKYISTANENTIRSYYKDARKADAVIFYSERGRDIDILSAVNREKGRYASLGRDITELPKVYVMNEDGILRLLE